ncbi:hypothetical protein CYMTET_48847 [Cymbomonas tetramitiformis]|uniref:Uncharacterized protein n=1 Tax=Cymbomonas tetramitiformis TaxID=36881 RepID=A0AAE0BRD3_9CHLO|nr:hypothetical protein CYMTET_48847 [Cymbomonas tetramitiformis]
MEVAEAHALRMEQSLAREREALAQSREEAARLQAQLAASVQEQEHILQSSQQMETELRASLAAAQYVLHTLREEAVATLLQPSGPLRTHVARKYRRQGQQMVRKVPGLREPISDVARVVVGLPDPPVIRRPEPLDLTLLPPAGSLATPSCHILVSEFGTCSGVPEGGGGTGSSSTAACIWIEARARVCLCHCGHLLGAACGWVLPGCLRA